MSDNHYYNYENSGDTAFENVQRPEFTERAPAVTSGIAVTSLVLGILGIILSCCYGFGAILAIVGIILAIVDRRHNGSFSGVALGGLITSVIALIIGLIIVIFVASLVPIISDILGSEDFDSIFESILESAMLEA